MALGSRRSFHFFFSTVHAPAVPHLLSRKKREKGKIEAKKASSSSSHGNGGVLMIPSPPFSSSAGDEISSSSPNYSPSSFSRFPTNSKRKEKDFSPFEGGEVTCWNQFNCLGFIAAAPSSPFFTTWFFSFFFSFSFISRGIFTGNCRLSRHTWNWPSSERRNVWRREGGASWKEKWRSIAPFRTNIRLTQIPRQKKVVTSKQSNIFSPFPVFLWGTKILFLWEKPFRQHHPRKKKKAAINAFFFFCRPHVTKPGIKR